MSDDIEFQLDEVQPPEVLNSVLDNLNISMKTRVSMVKIKGFSKHFYKELIDKRKTLKEPLTARQCFNLTMCYIQELLCSLDDPNNRVIKVVEGLKGMQVMKQEVQQPGQLP